MTTLKEAQKIEKANLEPFIYEGKIALRHKK